VDREQPDETGARQVGGGEFPILGDESTVSDYLHYAALNNAGLRAAFARWKAALERIPQAGALADPRFTYAYYIEEVETRVGPQRQKFGLSQSFPWLGTLRHRKDAASQAAAAAERMVEDTKLRLFSRVAGVFCEYWYLARSIEVTEAHIQLVTNLERVARARFKAATAPHGAMIQAQIELARLEDQLRTLTSLRGPLVARMNAELSQPAAFALPWPRELPERHAVFTDEDVLAQAAQQSPQLRRLDHLVKRESAAVRLAGSAYFPDVTLGVDYVDTGDAIDSEVADSGKDPVMGMVSVTLPLWYGKQRAASREARLRRSAAEADRDDAARRLAAELRLALHHFRDAERKVDLYAYTLIPKAEQFLKVAQQEFENGQVSFGELIDAQRQLLEFEHAHDRARSNVQQRLAQIDMLVGIPLVDEDVTGRRMSR